MPVWGWTSQNNLNKLQKHQNRAARIVTNDLSLDKKGIDNVHSLDWLNVRERINFIIHIMTFKCIVKIVSKYCILVGKLKTLAPECHILISAIAYRLHENSEPLNVKTDCE